MGLEVFLRLNCTHIRGYMHIPDINPPPFQTKKTGKNLEEGIREKEKEEKMVKERKERGRKHH